VQGKQYIQTPRIDKMVCIVAGAGLNAHGPNVGAAHDLLSSRRQLRADHEHKTSNSLHGEMDPKPEQYGGLPTLDGFKFEGHIKYNGKTAEMWTYKLKVRPHTLLAMEIVLQL
jgi:hypothetical protein